MPSSLPEGKGWIAERILKIYPLTVLDVGVGMGTYSRLLKPILDPCCTFIGFEIFEPYVKRYRLHEHYHAIMVEDVRDIASFPPADVVILGDVLEHMEFKDAVRVLQRSREAARKAVFLSIPIIEWPQGSEGGNEHEAHVHVWDHDMVMNLGGVLEYWIGTSIGVYMFGPEAVHVTL